jgi:hypothetical protein
MSKTVFPQTVKPWVDEYEAINDHLILDRSGVSICVLVLINGVAAHGIKVVSSVPPKSRRFPEITKSMTTSPLIKILGEMTKLTIGRHRSGLQDPHQVATVQCRHALEGEGCQRCHQPPFIGDHRRPLGAVLGQGQPLWCASGGLHLNIKRSSHPLREFFYVHPHKTGTSSAAVTTGSSLRGSHEVRKKLRSGKPTITER